jgi:hypothetical protein
LVALAAITGCTFASGLLPSCETALTTVNPCGSIFGFCEPTDMDVLFGDVPDWDLDPTCTIPYFDSTEFQGGGGGGGGGQQNLGRCAGGPIFPFTPGPRPD